MVLLSKYRSAFTYLTFVGVHEVSLRDHGSFQGFPLPVVPVIIMFFACLFVVQRLQAMMETLSRTQAVSTSIFVNFCMAL